MKTKHTEYRHSTSNVEEMQLMYLAERLVRTWNEDFTDEDTGEVVSISRHEVILNKGTFLDSNAITEIMFFLSSGDIKEVVVSDTKRSCLLLDERPTLYTASLELNTKKKTIYLYAKSIISAFEICQDYIEQSINKGTFTIKGIKRLDYLTIIPDEELDVEETFSENNDIYTYKANVEITEIEDGFKQPSEFIVKGSNVEDIKKSILKFVTFNRLKNSINGQFELSIVSAKIIPCDFIIEEKFSEEYLKE